MWGRMRSLKKHLRSQALVESEWCSGMVGAFSKENPATWFKKSSFEQENKGWMESWNPNEIHNLQMILSRKFFFPSKISSILTLEISVEIPWFPQGWCGEKAATLIGKTRWKRKESLKSPWRFPRRLEEWRSWDGWLRMKKSGKRLRWMSTQWNSRLHNIICNKCIYCSVETVEIYIYVYIRIYIYISTSHVPIIRFMNSKSSCCTGASTWTLDGIWWWW